MDDRCQNMTLSNLLPSTAVCNLILLKITESRYRLFFKMSHTVLRTNFRPRSAASTLLCSILLSMLPARSGSVPQAWAIITSRLGAL
ncbi:hypothetical protein BU16DRAFT_64089 [Lophium mytilinum]|uniref:Uncharacterized protein n=1 Tax=Lophium mytilinum TaxID=390894 RepID=A0A6A6QPM1_9PEZI|nr:hypothetical protein BU16DRAFT_64089 [Lophium mytilinum]